MYFLLLECCNFKGIIYFIAYLPHSIIYNYAGGIRPYQKCLASLLSNVAFSMGCDIIGLYETKRQGINWKTFYESPVSEDDDDVPLNVICLMLLLDAFIYMFLAWYIEGILPGTYGVRKPFYFPLQPSYWCGKEFARKYKLSFFDHYSPYKKIKAVLEAERKKRLKRGLHEVEDEVIREPFEMNNEKIGIQIIDLHKIYSRGNNYALKGLTVNFYENEITSFLG